MSRGAVNQKYTIEKDRVNHAGGVMLYRIRALRDIPEHRVKAGDYGGWISSEYNLSRDGAAWVGGNAIVCERARVGGDALVTGNAGVFGNVKISGNCVIRGNVCVFS